MTDESLPDLVEKASERNIEDEHGKPLPYLGWFWRDISTFSEISWHDGQYWINAAKKWDYPGNRIADNEEDLQEFREEIKEVLEKIIEQGGILKEDKLEAQRILADWAGDIHKQIYECPSCGEIKNNGYRMWDHKDDEHPDEDFDLPSAQDGEVISKNPEEIIQVHD